MPPPEEESLIKKCELPGYGVAIGHLCKFSETSGLISSYDVFMDFPSNESRSLGMSNLLRQSTLAPSDVPLW